MAAGSRPLDRLVRSGRAAADIAISTAPILHRELIGLLRTRKVFWLTALVVAATGLFPLLSWPEAGSAMPFMNAYIAFTIYQGIFGATLFLLVPIIAGSSITIERERDTYEALYSTLIRPSGLVLGKLLTSTAFICILIALTFPMACILYLLGGFSFAQFGMSLKEMLLATLFYALVGLWSSVMCRRTAVAVILSFAFLIAYSVAMSMVAGLLLMAQMVMSRGAPNPLFFQLIQWLNDIPRVVVIAVLWILLLRRARLPDLGSTPRGERRALRAAAAGRKPRPRRLTWLTRALLAPARDGIPDRWNPVLVCSIRGEVFGAALARRLLFWGMAILIFMVLAFTYLLIPMRITRQTNLTAIPAAYICAYVPIYAIALLMPGVSAAALTGERELGKLDFLRGALLAPGAILRGKLLASAFGSTGPLGLLAVAGILLFPLLVLEGKPEYLVHIFGSVFPAAISVAAVSITAGLLAATLIGRTLPAMILSYLFTGVYLLGLPFIVALMFQGDLELTRLGAALSPLVEFSFASVPEPEGDPSLACFLTSLAVGGGVAIAQYQSAAAVFHKRWMRDS